MFRLLRWLSKLKICLQSRRHRFDSWIGKTPHRRKWQPTPVFLSEKPYRQRSLADDSPWGCKESDIQTDGPNVHCSTVYNSQDVKPI